MVAVEPILKRGSGSDLAMEALYFGAKRELFGVRTEADGTPRRTAVLICPSWGPEYMRWYRALFGLSQALAARGFETLRFDYFCTGDSEGYIREASVERWLEDIAVAAKELRMLSGAERIALLGVRLGGLLAATALQRGLRAEQLVLWDATEHGASWLAQLQQLNRAFYQRKNRYLGASMQLRAESDQLIGFLLPRALQSALCSLRLQPDALPRGTLWLRSHDEAAVAPASVHETPLPDDAHWREAAWLTTPWNSPANIRAVVERLDGLLP